MNIFTTKFSREVKNPGGCNTPLGGNVDRNSLVVGGLRVPQSVYYVLKQYDL